jgi:anti-sigma factor RsiW
VTCGFPRWQLEAYADGELDPAESTRIEAHVRTCAECRAVIRSVASLGEAVRTGLPYHAASDVLRAQVRAQFRAQVSAQVRLDADPVGHLATVLPSPAPSSAGPLASARHWRLVAIAASLCAAAIGTHDVATRRAVIGDRVALDRELVSNHVRSLMVGHLVDVASSDRHTVKPWFEGKLTFSPSVFDFASEGFPLVGGRMDVAAGVPAAALVFRDQRHAINVFVFPTDSLDSGIVGGEFGGHRVVRWRRRGLQFAAVSTASDAVLRRFAGLYITRDSLVTVAAPH